MENRQRNVLLVFGFGLVAFLLLGSSVYFSFVWTCERKEEEPLPEPFLTVLVFCNGRLPLGDAAIEIRSERLPNKVFPETSTGWDGIALVPYDFEDDGRKIKVRLKYTDTIGTKSGKWIDAKLERDTLTLAWSTFFPGKTSPCEEPIPTLASPCVSEQEFLKVWSFLNEKQWGDAVDILEKYTTQECFTRDLKARILYGGGLAEKEDEKQIDVISGLITGPVNQMGEKLQRNSNSPKKNNFANNKYREMGAYTIAWISYQRFLNNKEKERPEARRVTRKYLKLLGVELDKKPECRIDTKHVEKLCDEYGLDMSIVKRHLETVCTWIKHEIK